MRDKLIAMVGAAALIAALVGGWMWAKQPDYVVLFSNISDQDGGAIVSALTQQNVPYKFTEGGGAILVPSSQVHDLRLRLAAQGLPRGGMVGFELMEGQKLGISQFAEQVNYQRALEGELARSIQSLAAVQAARVHLAIPKQVRVPARYDRSPRHRYWSESASRARPRRGADRRHRAPGGFQRAATGGRQCHRRGSERHLVSAINDACVWPVSTRANSVTCKELEKSYVQRIEAILTPITGRDNVRAQVAADVDFSQIEQTAETYKPNGAPESQCHPQPAELRIRLPRSGRRWRTRRAFQSASGARDGTDHLATRSRNTGQRRRSAPDQHAQGCDDKL